MTKVLLLGAAGQIGQALQAASLPPKWRLHPAARSEIDIADHRATQTKLQELQPELIINCAAMTAVDKCEAEQDKAVAANFEGPANLAAQCSAMDIPLIHLSTDYVFDGQDGNRPYRPDDQMAPVSVYGNTKMMGEESIRHDLAWHVILRVSSVFSEYGTNILTKALDAIDSRDELKLVTDQVSCPTYAPDIADAVVKIGMEIMKGRSDIFGTYHYCGMPETNRLEFTQAVMDAYAPYTTKRPKISPAVTADFLGFAARPPYSALDCTKTRQVFGIEQQEWRARVVNAVKKLKGRRLG